jgi:hypothetical protein
MAAPPTMSPMDAVAGRTTDKIPPVVQTATILRHS